jgi:hypothetical protein
MMSLVDFSGGRQLENARNGRLETAETNARCRGTVPSRTLPPKEIGVVDTVDYA